MSVDWREAQRIVGTSNEDDYILDLEEHCDRYTDDAPALAALLERAGARAVARSYQRFDQDALDAAARYRRWMFRTNLAVLITSVATASAMAWSLAATEMPSLQSGLLAQGNTVLGIMASIAAAVGAAGLFVLRQGRLLETWMSKRATAESHRTAYFEDIVARAVEAPSPAPILGLEYFRRYQFEVQKAYLLNRARQHESSARTTVILGSIGAAVAALTSVAGVASDVAQHVLGAFTVFGASLGAYAIGREQMTQDRRNAERYFRTYASLVELARKLDDVREAVIEGRPKAAREFSLAVDEHISNEHRQWLEKTEATQASMARIEEALSSS